jgi:predicted DNA-binding transcriptional regulator AlpA
MSKAGIRQSDVDSLKEAVLLRAADCARLCRVSRRTWFRLAASARTPASIRLGASPVWRREDLDLWISLGCPSREEFAARKEVQNAGKK